MANANVDAAKIALRHASEDADRIVRRAEDVLKAAEDAVFAQAKAITHGMDNPDYEEVRRWFHSRR